jgi:hypothetical protein
LDAEELEGVAAVAVDEFALESAEAGELDGDVSGVGEDGEDGDDEAEVEAACGGLLRGRRVFHWEKDITWRWERQRWHEVRTRWVKCGPSRKGIRDAKNAPQRRALHRPLSAGRDGEVVHFSRD